MTEHKVNCPTCGRRLDANSLTQKIIALLQYSPTPLPPAQIRAATGSTSGTVYQTLRRLHERGAIRRATRQGTSGWEINPSGRNEEPSVATPDYAAMQPTPEKEAAQGIVWSAVAKLNRAGIFPTVESLVSDLVSMGHGERADLEWAIWAMGRSNVVKERTDGGLEMPEELRGSTN